MILPSLRGIYFRPFHFDTPCIYFFPRYVHTCKLLRICIADPTNPKQCVSKNTNIFLSAYIGDNFKPLCNMHKIAMMAGLLRVFFSSFIFPYIFFLVLSCHGQSYTSQVKAWLIFWQIKWGFVCTKMMKYGWNHGLPETSPLFICQNRAVLITSFSVFIVLEIYNFGLAMATLEYMSHSAT